MAKPSVEKALFNLGGSDTLAEGSGREANYGIPAMGSDGTNIVVMKMDADGKSVSIIQGQFVDGVPTEITTDGETASLLINAFRELIIAGYNRSENALDINDIASAIIETLQPGAQTTLTAPGDGTPVGVEDYHYHTWQVVIAAIDATVDVRIAGSLDGTNYGNTAASDTQYTANGTYFIKVAENVGEKYKYLKPVFVAESGSNVTVTFTYMGGN
jgi:hypothetical protein